MFCKNCGKKLDDDAKFCNECGAKTEVAEEVICDKNEESSKAEKSNEPEKDNADKSSTSGLNSFKNKKIIGIIAVAVILILAALKIFVPAKTCEETVDEVINYFVAGESQKITDLLYDKYFDLLAEDYDYENKEDFYSVLEKDIDALGENLKYELGEDFEIRYKITTNYEADSRPEIPLGNLYTTEEKYIEVFEKLDAMKDLYIEVKFISDERTYNGEISLVMVEYKGDWKILDYSYSL